MPETESKLNYAQYYKRWHDDSPESEKRQLEYFDRVLNGLVPQNPEDPVLDVGCGCGHLLQVLHQKGCTRLLGIDRDAELVAATRKRGLPAERVTDALDFLSEQSARFSMICACDILEHIPRENQLRFTRALFKALKPGGTLLLTVPNANSAIAARWRYNDLTHHASFTESSLDHLLYLGGFAEISIGGFELMAPPPNPWKPTFWSLRWFVLRLLRALRRLEMKAEFGSKEGKAIPLTPNLRAVARVPAS